VTKPIANLGSNLLMVLPDQIMGMGQRSSAIDGTGANCLFFMATTVAEKALLNSLPATLC
jgi:hypothetical protein